MLTRIYKKRKNILNLQWKIVLLVCIVLMIPFFVTNSLIAQDVVRRTNEHFAGKVCEISHVVAQSKVVIEGLEGDRPKEDIQSYSNMVREIARVDFIEVLDANFIQTYSNMIRKIACADFVEILDMNSIQTYHPDETDVVATFMNVEAGGAASLKMEEHLSIAEYVCRAGKSASAPITNEDGEQIGVVFVGISTDYVNRAIKDNRRSVIIGSIIGLCIGVLGAVFLGRHIKKILFNLEPIQIATLLKERDAMLQSVKEGIIAVDKNLKITLVNEEATRILQTTTEIVDCYIGEHIPIFQKVLETSKEQVHLEEKINGVNVLLSCIPIVIDNEIVGAIATFRDKSEVKKLSEELTGIQLYTETLRAQSHEFMNKLHVVSGLVQVGAYDKLIEYIQQVAHQYGNEVSFIVGKIKTPVFAGFLLGKYSQARENDVELIVAKECYLPDLKDDDIVHQLIEIVGNLLNNAIEALKDSENKIIELFIRYEEEHIYIEVRDTGNGIAKEIRNRIFEKDFSTRGKNRGLGLHLVQQNVKKLKGEMNLFTVVGKGTSFHITLPYKAKEEET